MLSNLNQVALASMMLASTAFAALVNTSSKIPNGLNIKHDKRRNDMRPTPVRRDSGQVFTENVIYYEHPSETSCNYSPDSDDYILFIPPSVYGDVNSASEICGAYVTIISNDDNNLSVTGYVAGTSYSEDTVAISKSAYDAISPDDSASSIMWYFYTTDSQQAVSVQEAYDYYGDGDAPPSSPTSTNPAPSPTHTHHPHKYSGYMTYYYQDGRPNACGQVNDDSQYIAAIDSAMYDDGDNCWRTVRVEANGKSVDVQIVDECPTCDTDASLDLSPSAFQEIADLKTGILPMQWYFLD